MGAPTYTAEDLLANVAWVREFAAAVARDPHAADDAAQETFAAALARPPARTGSLRAWLARVVRNALRQGDREASRRRRREATVARGEALPSTLELAARAAAQRAVVGAALELPEPYRGTVLLRFFEGLAPKAIAEREGVPVATVYTRLARAFERLRGQLDREHGGRAAWAAAIGPWKTSPLAGPPAALGGLVVNVKVAVAVGAALVLAAGFWFASSGRAGSEAPTTEVGRANPGGAPRAAVAEGPVPAEQRLAQAGEPKSANASEASAAISSAPALAVAARKLTGRVLDLDARGVAGVDVRLVGIAERDFPALDAPLATATTDGDGRFSLPAASRPSGVEVASARWETVLAATGGADGQGSRVLVVAPAIALGGFVHDDLGRPIEGARVEVLPPEGFRASFHEILDLSVTRTWSVATDSAGKFEIARVPQIPGARLRTSRAGFATNQQPEPQANALGLAVLLKRETAAAGSIVGRVLGSSDAPIAGARVSAGEQSVRTGDDGRFALASPARATTVTAAKEGLLPDSAHAANGVWPDPLVLRLVEPAKRIAGVVVDSDGKPVA
ncbi:MAG TPA: sigma-70 family RNA polymerase sigma factor, partial [Planctomycetota bacterium]|nr:sigma-70 family RNA polymerase sigma factor [Planctomycetota bacterium]